LPAKRGPWRRRRRRRRRKRRRRRMRRNDYSNWRVTGQTRDHGVRHSTSATNTAKAFTLDICP
jgi:hypothetical protein